MFSALRLGSLVYLLYKSEAPKLKIGTVTAVSSPLFTQYMTNDSTVNVQVKVDDTLSEFKLLPSSQVLATYENVIISESREAMLNEVDSMVRNSKLILDSIDYHKNIVERGEEMVKILNPLYAKLKEQSEKIDNLENKMGSMEHKLDSITEMITKVLIKHDGNI